MEGLSWTVSQGTHLWFREQDAVVRGAPDWVVGVVPRSGTGASS